MTATTTTMVATEAVEEDVADAADGVLAVLRGQEEYQEEVPPQGDQPPRGPRAVEVVGQLQHPLINLRRRRVRLLRHQLPRQLPSLETTVMIVRGFSTSYA